MTPLLLTLRTIMTASTGDYHPLDGRLTNEARFAFPAIDSVLQLEKALFAVRVHVVGHRGTAERDRLPQHFLDSQVKATQILAPKRRCPPPRPDCRPEQRLIRIDVAHSTQQLLIEQGALNGRFAATEQA